jgi:hypothetical protein
MFWLSYLLSCYNCLFSIKPQVVPRSMMEILFSPPKDVTIAAFLTLTVERT